MFKDKKVLLAYLSVCIIWGSTYLAIKIGVKDVPPLIFAGTRFIVAGLIMFAYAKHKRMTFPEGRVNKIRVSIIGVLLLTGANGIVSYAEQYVDSGMVSLILAITPLVLMLLEVVVLRAYKIPFRAAIGILTGFGGVVYLILSSTSLGSVHFFGVMITFLAPLSWAVGSIYSKMNKVEGDMLPIISYQMLAGGTGQVLVGLMRNEIAQFEHITMNAALAWLYLVVFGALVGYSSYIYILEKLPASIAGTYGYVNPIVAVILGSVVLGEQITIQVVISTLIIITSVVFVAGVKSNAVGEQSSESLMDSEEAI